MKYILINAIGCGFSGSKIILEELVNHYKYDYRLILYVSNQSKYNFTTKNIEVHTLRHSIFGRYLRVLYELYYNLKALFNRNIKGIINLSNYGLCLNKNYILYLHNSLIVDQNSNISFSGGNKNFLKDLFLSSCFNKANLIVVQTEHMFTKVIDYCNTNKIKVPNMEVVKPYKNFYLTSNYKGKSKNFAFQFFYPSSNFAHKNEKLAIEAFAKLENDIGLIITANQYQPITDNVIITGQITRENVYTYMQTSNALLFLSSYESLGLPLIESMYFSKPAVLPDLPYAREIYGDSAVYFDSFELKSIVKAIKYLKKEIKYFEASVKDRSKSFFENRHDWSHHWSIFLKHLENE